MPNDKLNWGDIPCGTDFYLTGGKDYLILKEPIKVERREDGYHVHSLGITAPLSSSPRAIAKRISDVYKDLEHKATRGQLGGNGSEFLQWKTFAILLTEKACS